MERLTKIYPCACSKKRQIHSNAPILGVLRGEAIIQERPLMARVRSKALDTVQHLVRQL